MNLDAAPRRRDFFQCLVAEGNRPPDCARISMLSANCGAPRKYTIPQKHRRIERLVKVGEAILLVEQIVAEQRGSPPLTRPTDRKTRAQDCIGRLDRLRVRVGDDAFILLREEAEVRCRVPSPPGRTDTTGPVEAQATAPFRRVRCRLASQILSRAEPCSGAGR